MLSESYLPSADVGINTDEQIQGQDEESVEDIQRNENQEEDLSRRDVGQQQTTETEYSLDVVFKFLFNLAHYCGLVIAVKDGKTGLYVNRWFGAVPLFLCCLTSLLSFLFHIIIAWINKWPYWHVVLNIHPLLTFIFCIYTYVQVIKAVPFMTDYLDKVSKLSIRKTWYAPCLVILALLYPVGMDLSAMLVLEDIKLLPNLVPSLTMSIIPTVFDMYMGMFVIAIKYAFVKLERNMHQKEQWEEKDIQEFYRQWLDITGILQEHNQVFGASLHMRIWLFVVDSMVNILILISLEVYTGKCMILIGFAAVPLLETIIHFFFVCSLGELLERQDAGLREHLLRHTYEAEAGSPQQLTFSSFTSRLSAKPSEVMEGITTYNVSSKTFVTRLSLVLTTVAILIQLNPDGLMIESGDTCEGDAYGACFLHQRNESSNHIFFR